MDKIKVGIFMRCSTNLQDINSQKQALLDYCKKNNYEVCGIYEDVGVRGKASVKPMRDLMIDDIRKGKINKIVVFSICRLSRSVSDLIQFLETISQLNCSLFVLTQNLDTDTPFGKTIFYFVSIFSDFENQLQRNRIKAGLEARKKQGLSVGRKSSRTQGMNEAIKIMIEKGVGVRETMRKLQIGTKYYYEVAKSMNSEANYAN